MEKERLFSIYLTGNELYQFREYLKQKNYADPQPLTDSEKKSLDHHEVEVVHKKSTGILPRFDVNNQSISGHKVSRAKHKKSLEEQPSKRDILDMEYDEATKRGLLKNEHHTLGEKAVNIQGLDADRVLQGKYHKTTGMPSYLRDGKHRMSNIVVKDVDAKGQKYVRDYTKDLDDNVDDNTLKERYAAGSKAANELNEGIVRVRQTIDREEDLRKTGYDDRYSARGLENKLRKRIDADEAYNIAEKRSNLNKSYLESDKKAPGIIKNLGRKWNDASMVYNEATDDRSLGKDLAIATGAAVALGVGAKALVRHIDRKRLEKKIVKSKYKTEKG